MSASRTSTIGPSLFVMVTLMACSSLIACAPSTEEDEPAEKSSRIVELLSTGLPVFGIFSGEHTREQGATMAENRQTDFVFYSLESGPFDTPTMRSYMEGMADSAPADGPRPLALRIPPIRDGEEQAGQHVREGLAAGVAGIVFPHVESGADAAYAVRTMGEELWPVNEHGDLVNMLIVEDQVGIQHVREIISTPGISIVFAGPGDLRRAYNGDMEAVEDAIQTVLAACREFDVPCGITAGVDDIGSRLSQGFRVIIVTQPEALAVGLAVGHRAN